METEESAWAKHEGQWVPTEVRAPQMMAGQEGSETVIKVRGWRAFEIWDHFRILMEFCPLGDLWDLRLKTYHMSERNSEGHPRMPEPFLWYVFECLAAAGLMMVRLRSHAVRYYADLGSRKEAHCSRMLRSGGSKSITASESTFLSDGW